ncbi:glutathione S-transferase N-terminal domain-containing protein [Rhizobium leguminosarum]|uniref:glutathione S-transferase N-terminal domain-containing protein n=1 Tax=Rhizobium leguminosarum TaxID=384 RepID=UPI00143F5A4F|nr:glutathione S-transferase N-terminal domain-containing protein [Rhizobium leguminosarum]MBY5779382.1 glutathione S-transferase [Rhizobium leguminosarum]MBY5827516.1 glutathione S-transferase [Rhizobium leguminosarum]NKM65091.1 glutathione S-transferase [Rhizobium leguminosarum bv. viciae]
MKIYYFPMACSLADHIALQEAGVEFESERVDLGTKLTASGRNFREINAKGYVPALELDNGEVLTENIAILDWIASQFPKLGLPGEMGRTRLIEALTYISTELHRSFKPMWSSGSEQEMAEARAAILMRLEFLSEKFRGDYMFGENPSVADFYLFVMLLWAERYMLDVPKQLAIFRERMKSRAAVRVVMALEGLI